MKRIFFLFILLPFLKHTVAQNSISDSLQRVLKAGIHDTARIKTLNALSWELINTGNFHLATEYTGEVIELISKAKKRQTEISLLWLQTSLAKAYNNLGSIQYAKGDYDKAIEYYFTSLKIKEQIADKNGMAMSLNNIGLVHMEKGDYDKAIDFYLQSLKIREEIGDKKGMASSYNNIGEIHRHRINYDKALEYYLKSLRIREEIGDKRGMAYSYNNIGNIYENKNDYDNAIRYYLKCLQILTEIGDRQGLAQSYNNIGNIYGHKNETAKAIEYFTKGLKIRKEIGDKKGIAQSYGNIGKLYLNEARITEAKAELLKSLTMAKELKAKPEIKNAYFLLARSDSALGNFKSAFEYQKLYSSVKDSIFNEESNKVMSQLQASYESEKKDKEIIAKDAEIQKQQSESKQKSLQRNALVIGLFLSLILILFVLRSLSVNKKKNIIIATQKEIVEEKQKSITDSIKYAKRIQEAILPSEKTVQENLKDFFILYKPKDIVAGDFYWTEKVADSESSPVGKRQKMSIEALQTVNDKLTITLLAAADCTGHGVPGAMVSVVCSNALNRAVKEFKLKEPGKILDKVRELVIETFEKSESDVRDGMDISLCSLTYPPDYSLSSQERDGVRLQWAGANNPLWILRNNEIIEYKPDKQPIGKYLKNKSFTTHTIELQKNDTIYLLTDGYADQFGGEKARPDEHPFGWGKKFKYSKLKELLLATSEKPMSEQKQILDETFETWKGNLEQVDDVCVIGVRI